MDDRLRAGRAGADVVAVEGDVDVAERHLGAGQLADAARAAGGRGPRRGCGCRPGPGPRDPGSSRRSRGRSAAASASDRRARARPSRSTRSFLASQDLVKGTDAARLPGGAAQPAEAKPHPAAISRARPLPSRRDSLARPVLDQLAARRARGRGSRPGRSRAARRAARTRPRLLEHRADVVAGGDVDQRQQLRRPPRGRRRPPGRRSSGPVSAARCASSSAKLASWISSSAPPGGAAVGRQGAVSPVITSLRPGRGSPITSSGPTGPSQPATSSPRCSAAKAGPRRRRARRAGSASKRPGRSSSTSA